ncbi:MAG: alpha/beta hydrolase, partial [Boseongicola sp.]|nr:alpha/beta hydrolase [Boseongicola sp.]
MSLTNISMAQDLRQEVTFLTVRDLGSGKGPSPYFGDSRATLRAGFCTVRHADTGRLASVFESGPAFLKEQLLNVEQVAVLPLEDVLAKHEEAHNAPPALYVHGYFIDFEKGCRRSALLQQNARLDDRMVSFSWPSDGDLANYARDEADLYWSVIDIADAIVDLNARAGEAKY